ncbi:methyltransferase domain-containing protein [Patescibacteria group bacterium]|nr:methyltransferase domain-containing protein [Patescibacteria group bacterium]
MSIFSELKSPEVVYEGSSKYNPDIKIVKVGRTLRLTVEGYIQSVNYNSPACSKLFMGKTVDLIKREIPVAADFLVLGLGAGTMQKLISLGFQNADIVSVDIDQKMVDIAKKYYDLDSTPRHRIIVDDALRVVIEPEDNNIREGDFDVAVVDIFIGNSSPGLIKTGNFIAHLKKLVRPDGLVVFNRNYTTDFQEDANVFAENLGNYLRNVRTEVVAGYTNSDNILIYGRV